MAQQKRASSTSRPAPRPASRPALRRRPSRRRPSYLLRISLAAAGLVVVLLVWAIAARSLAPRANTTRSTFDAIIVLGTPTDSDGNPTPAILDRVSEGVREYERGVAPHIVVTGAAAHNRFVEADAMARVARAQGVPPSAVLEEPHALDTIQNLCYSARILKEHGWHSAEIISNASHLPRAAMIASNLPHSLALQWRVHTAPDLAAPDNLSPGIPDSVLNVAEILKTARYLVWARWLESCES